MHLSLLDVGYVLIAAVVLVVGGPAHLGVAAVLVTYALARQAFRAPGRQPLPPPTWTDATRT